MANLFSFSEDSGTPPDPAPVAAGGGAAPHQVAVASANARADLEKTPRRRTRSDAGTSRAGERALQAEIEQRVAAQMESLHDPKAWAALLSLPADAALTITGNKRWNIEDRERETLGVTGSAAARTMMFTNPRTLAFMMVGSALFSVYLPRVVEQLKEMREKADAAAKAAKDGAKT